MGGGWIWALGIVDNTSPWAPQSCLPCIAVTSVQIFIFLSLTSGSWGTGAFLYCVVTKVFQIMGFGLCPAFLPRSGLSGPRQGLLQQLRHYAGVLVPSMRCGANCLCLCLCLSLGPPAQYLPETKRMLMSQLCNMFLKVYSRSYPSPLFLKTKLLIDKTLKCLFKQTNKQTKNRKVLGNLQVATHTEQPSVLERVQDSHCLSCP